MELPVKLDGPSEAQVRSLRSVPPPATAGDVDAAGLADELAAALRAVRGYVPNRIWWEAGPAQALLAYQTLLGE